VTAARQVAVIALAAVIAACGARPSPGAPMTTPDDATAAALPTPYAVELTLAPDAAAGRATLRLVSHGGSPLAIVLPERADQIEWFDPDARMLALPSLHVMWTAWRLGGGALTGDSRPSAAQRASRHATLSPGGSETASVDLGAALDGADGWCARAWLVGGAHPLPSNVVCWPARPR